MNKFMFAALVVVVLLAMAIPVGATTPSDVEIDVETSFLGTPGPFVASGSAVDDGVICDSGVVVDATSKVTGFSSQGFNFQGVKQFTCDDDSGEFYVNVQARIDFRKGINFHWNVLSGTGAYVDLHGAGEGIGIDGVPCGDPSLCVLDIYDGGLHID